jgi:hypothetical protein
VASAPITFGLRVLISQALDYWIDHGGLSFWDSYWTDPTFQGRKVSLVFDRPAEANLSTRDTIITSFALFKISATSPDPSWDSGDYSDAETIIETWWGATKGFYSSDLTFEEIRWYNEGPEVTPPNPVVRTTSVGVAATSSDAALPPQVSTTVTLMTPLRKYWGRMYLPAPRTGALNASGTSRGRWDTGFVDDWCDDTKDMFNDLGAIGLIPAVYSRAGNAFMAVTGVEVDDVPDIQRRRRFATTGYRKQDTLG